MNWKETISGLWALLIAVIKYLSNREDAANQNQLKRLKLKNQLAKLLQRKEKLRVKIIACKDSYEKTNLSYELMDVIDDIGRVRNELLQT